MAAAMLSRFWILGLACLLISLSISLSIGVGDARGQSLTTDKPLATIDGYPISEQSVLRWLKKTLPHAAASSATAPELIAYHSSLVNGALDYLVKRRIVFEYLSAKGIDISAEETKLELDQLAAELEQMSLTIAEYLERENLSQAELEFEFQWQLAWKRYLEKVLTDTYLQQHYDRHRRRFDRSEMHVAQLLIVVDEKRAKVDAIELAQQIYRQIQQAHDLDTAWREAVAQHSQAPSKNEAGEMGWIRFQEPMPESFSEAAFALQPGEISPPFVTPIGVHLVRCLELREGKMGWRDALSSVRLHATKTLFDQIAAQHAPQVKVDRRVNRHQSRR